MAISFELKPRIWRDNAIALGPGKADLLDAIAQTGSISAAARAILAGVGKYALIPLDHFPTMERGAVVTTKGTANPMANKYIAFLGSSKARAIFDRYGFLLPDTTAK